MHDHIDIEALSDKERDVLRRWRLALGPQSQSTELALAGLIPRGRLARLDAALDAVLGQPDSSKDLALHLNRLREELEPRVFAFVQRSLLRRPDLAGSWLTAPGLRSLDPTVELVAALMRWHHRVSPAARAQAQGLVRSALGGVRDRMRPAVERAVSGMVRREIVVALDQSPVLGSSMVHGLVLASLLARHATVRVLVFGLEAHPLPGGALEAPGGPSDDPLVPPILSMGLTEGTDLSSAVVAAAAGLDDPESSLVLLVSDLFHDGPERSLMVAVRTLLESGARMVCVQGFDEHRPPHVNRALARRLGQLGAPSVPGTVVGLENWLRAAFSDTLLVDG